MTNLSPTSQLVLDAAFLVYDEEEHLYVITGKQHAGIIAAAALRAAADQLREAYANEEYVDSADDWLDAIAAELRA